jgi:2-phosphoglycerate kinase
VSKPVVLVGGASGAGKTTLAGRLKCELALDHFLGTGFIRAIVQAETTPERDPELFSMTFQSPDPVNHIITQARRLQPAIQSCISRARREGTSVVIEGTHLIPELYHDAGADLYVILKVPDPAEHSAWVRGDTHTHRSVDEGDLVNIRSIDTYLMAAAATYDVTVIEPHTEIAWGELLSLRPGGRP